MHDSKAEAAKTLATGLLALQQLDLHLPAEPNLNHLDVRLPPCLVMVFRVIS